MSDSQRSSVNPRIHATTAQTYRANIRVSHITFVLETTKAGVRTMSATDSTPGAPKRVARKDVPRPKPSAGTRNARCKANSLHPNNQAAPAR